MPGCDDIVVCEALASERQRECSFDCCLRRITIRQMRNSWKLLRREHATPVHKAQVFLSRLEDAAGTLWIEEGDHRLRVCHCGAILAAGGGYKSDMGTGDCSSAGNV
jgi:hypothetical protein